MLNEKKMHDYFWTEVVATTVYIMNINSTIAIHGRRNIKVKTRYFAFENIWLYSLCSRSFDERRTKLDPKAKKLHLHWLVSVTKRVLML